MLRANRAHHVAIVLCQLGLATLVSAHLLLASAGASISGTLKDPSDSVISDARLTLVDPSMGSEFHATSDSRGFYSFPALPAGRYNLTMEATGFQAQKKNAVAVDVDTAVMINATLELAQQSQAVTVVESAVNSQTQVDTVSTYLGGVLLESQIQAIPLNGRNTQTCLPFNPASAPQPRSRPRRSLWPA
jgi:hypothetical protein